MSDKKPLTVEEILAQYGIRMEDSARGKFLAIPKSKKESK